MPNKTCNRCGLDRDRTDFYLHPQSADGLMGKCKRCHKADVKSNRDAKREKYAAYEQLRAKDPDRKAKRADYQRKHRASNWQKYRARRKLQTEVSMGRITPQPCTYCSNPKSQAHHPDYSKPLDVIWACFKCHREMEHGQVVVAIPF